VGEPGATPALRRALNEHRGALRKLTHAQDLDEVRGLEGQAASAYFGALNDMILSEGFKFGGRTKRPPRDAVNSLLSFLYALLIKDCVAALEGVGLDPQVGYLHAIRPGRPALALDLMEEFRAWLTDRLTLALLNRRQLVRHSFEDRPGGAIYLGEKGRKVVITAYQKRKQEKISHPLLKNSVPIGALPHLQARLLARYLRGDLEAYLPFTSR
jgi:CRISPR-associated protein Cas1